MADREVSMQNWFATTLTSGITAGDLTIPVDTIGNLTSPTIIVIEPESDTKREVVLADGTWGAASFVCSDISSRGLSGSASGAQFHDSGAVVEVRTLKQHFEDLHDRVENHNHSGGTAGTTVDAGKIDGFEATQLVPVGTVQMYGGATAPSKWLLCDGSAVSRSTYADLFSALGETFGVGNGTTTFNLPDLRDRFPVGAGTTYARAATGGEAQHTLTEAELPGHIHGTEAHSHNVPGHSHDAGSLGVGITARGFDSSHFHLVDNDNFAGGGGGNTTTDAKTYAATGTTGPSGTLGTTSRTPNTTSTGSGSAHENRPPYIGLNFIVFAGV